MCNNEIARIILKADASQFNPNLYNLEYRKNKDYKLLQDMIANISEKCSSVDDMVPILSVNIKNLFKNSKLRKMTLIQKIDNVYQTQDILAGSIDNVISTHENVVSILSGSCKLEYLAS